MTTKIFKDFVGDLYTVHEGYMLAAFTFDDLDRK